MAKLLTKRDAPCKTRNNKCIRQSAGSTTRGDPIRVVRPHSKRGGIPPLNTGTGKPVFNVCPPACDPFLGIRSQHLLMNQTGHRLAAAGWLTRRRRRRLPQTAAATLPAAVAGCCRLRRRPLPLPAAVRQRVPRPPVRPLAPGWPPRYSTGCCRLSGPAWRGE